MKPNTTALSRRDRLVEARATLVKTSNHATQDPLGAKTQQNCFVHQAHCVSTKIHSQVLGNQWAIVRDPVTFPEPEVLKPERFLDENGQFVSHDNLIQFSLGKGHQISLETVRSYFLSSLCKRSDLDRIISRLHNSSI